MKDPLGVVVDGLAAAVAGSVVRHSVEADLACLRAPVPKTVDKAPRIHSMCQVEVIEKVDQYEVVAISQRMHLDRRITHDHIEVGEPVQLEMGSGQAYHHRIQFNSSNAAFYPEFVAQDGRRAARS